MMKYPVLLFFLLVGLAVSVSAANVSSELYGSWTSYDGPCSPCRLNIQSSGVTFTQVGDTVEVIHAQGTPEPGIDVYLEGGGELDLKITKNSKRLVGFYSNYAQVGYQAVVTFDRK